MLLYLLFRISDWRFQIRELAQQSTPLAKFGFFASKSAIKNPQSEIKMIQT